MSIQQRTIGEQLANYEKQFGTSMSVSRIPASEPWVRVQYWAKHVRLLGKEMDGYWRGEVPDDLSADFHRAMAEWRKELKAIEDRTALAIAMREHGRNAVLMQAAGEFA